MYLSCFCQLLKNLWGLPYSGSRQHADLMLSFPDMTNAWWGPILIVNTSPYFFWRLVNAKWVFFPSRCRWPMMGKRKYGPETHSRFLKYFQEKHFRFALKYCRFLNIIHVQMKKSEACFFTIGLPKTSDQIMYY